MPTVPLLVVVPLLALVPAYAAVRKGYPAMPFWLGGLVLLLPALALALFLPDRRAEVAGARLDRLRAAPLARALAGRRAMPVGELAGIHGASERATGRLLRHLAEGDLAEEVAEGWWRGTQRLRRHVHGTGV